jgi:hypothetical protein
MALLPLQLCCRSFSTRIAVITCPLSSPFHITSLERMTAGGGSRIIAFNLVRQIGSSLYYII